ncbi:uncharacterized protein PG986_011448 [Apiospora aurea]|uniref:Uncharacterized protein n=1 Tax=Apiospora aurea TaxID=335848 RepID=A0ABR1Q558_9PEZI
MGILQSRALQVNLPPLPRDCTPSTTWPPRCRPRSSAPVWRRPLRSLATENATASARGGYGAKGREQVDTRELFTAEGGESFRITYRQVRLMLHHVRYGHGIPARYFCRELSSLWTKEPLRLSPPRPSNSSVLSAPSKSLLGMPPRPPLPPRWRRRAYVGVDDSNCLCLLDQHELLYGGHDAQVVRRFLDQTPYRVCPHLATHDPSRRNNSSGTDDDSSDSGISAPPLTVRADRYGYGPFVTRQRWELRETRRD